MSRPGTVKRSWVFVALLLASIALMMGGCQTGLGGINVAREAGLASTVAVEISEQANKPDMERLRQGVITDPATIEQMVKALDRPLPLGPLAECLAQYRLRFRLADGTVEELEYFCEGGDSFLRGSQPFWKQQEVRPTTEFDALMQRIFATSQ